MNAMNAQAPQLECVLQRARTFLRYRVAIGSTCCFVFACGGSSELLNPDHTASGGHTIDTDSGAGGAGGATTTSTTSTSSTTSSEGGAPPATPQPGSKWTADPGFFDAVLDHERHRAFLSYGLGGFVEVVDLLDGTVTKIVTDHRAEYMDFDPKQDRVVVSLPIQDHSAYWYDYEQEGFVGVLDAAALTLLSSFPIPVDPWQIQADGNGAAYVLPGSGQWAYGGAIELESGIWAYMEYSIRDKNNFRRHPGSDRVYATHTTLLPADVERYDTAFMAMTYVGDSIYHGEHPMCGDLRISQDGAAIVTRCGNVFAATNDPQTDMVWSGAINLTDPWVDMAISTSMPRAYALRTDTQVDTFDTTTLELLGWKPVLSAKRLLAGPGYVVLIRDVPGNPGSTELEIVDEASL